jgi:hypothetical protein
MEKSDVICDEVEVKGAQHGMNQRIKIDIRMHNSLSRYSDGAKMSSMGLTKCQEVAKDAKACCTIGHLVLIITEVSDQYLETFHITDSALS